MKLENIGLACFAGLPAFGSGVFLAHAFKYPTIQGHFLVAMAVTTVLIAMIIATLEDEGYAGWLSYAYAMLSLVGYIFSTR